MNKSHPQVVVSNATRLHAHHLALGLSREGYLQRFITSLWHKPQQFPYRLAQNLPGSIGSSATSFLNRRYISGLDPNLVEQRWCVESQRLLADAATRGQYRDRLLFWHKRKHDSAVARRLKSLTPDIFIGYEISCRNSMVQAKRQGAITILDLAGLHYQFSHTLQQQFSGEILDQTLLQKLAERKEAELRAADYIFCLSTLAHDSLTSNGVSSDRLRLINLGADSEVFKFAPKPNRDKFVVLFVGAVARHKGVHILLEAFKRARLPNAELVLVGPIIESDLLSGYDGLFTHFNYMPHSELASHYQNADLFVLPSFLDSWGMVVNEAMACGTPVIVSQNVGGKDLVNQGNGFTVPAGDIEALGKQLKHCHANRSALADMGINAYQSVTKMTWNSYYTDINRTIENIWRERNRQAG